MGLIFDSILWDLGLLTAVVLTAVYTYFRHSYNYWKKRNVPYLEPTFILGNFADAFLSRKCNGDVFRDIYLKFDKEKYVGTYMFASPGFLLRDPELIKNVLVKDFSSFHDRGMYIDEEADPLMVHLFFLPGSRWRNLRVKLSPTFTSGKMKMMFHTLVDSGQDLKSVMEKPAANGDVVEIKDYLARYSTDVISSCAFGIQCNSLKNPDAEFRQWGRKFFEPRIKTSIVFLLSALAPKIINLFKMALTDADITKYFRTMVHETIEYREKNDYKRNDFMQLLIQLKNRGYVDPDEGPAEEDDAKSLGAAPANYKLTMDSLAAQAFVFFLAGFETSSTTMTFCLYELAVNPDIQERVRQEARAVLQSHDGKVSYEAILKMDYLDKVVAETLRKYPPVPVLNREATKEYKVPGSDLVLEKGMPTTIPIFGIHHDPKHYPDPERFDPERFSEEEKAKRHQYVYLPFGEGPRICIGMRFGLMQAKVGLVSLLSQYKFSVSAKTPIPLKLDTKSLVLAPEGGMWLKVEKC